MGNPIIGLFAVYKQWEAIQCIFDHMGETQSPMMCGTPSDVATLMVGEDGDEIWFKSSCDHRCEYLVVCAE